MSKRLATELAVTIASLLAAGTACADPHGSVAPVLLHELMLDSGGKHYGLLTTSEDEAYRVTHLQKFRAVALAWVYPSPVVGTVALYRYFAPATGDTYYTTNPVDGALHVKYSGYNLQGTCCYIATSVSTTQVSLYNFNMKKVNFYLSESSEESSWIRSYGASGVTGYVWRWSAKPPLGVPLSPNSPSSISPSLVR